VHGEAAEVGFDELELGCAGGVLEGISVREKWEVERIGMVRKWRPT
jgi:hypothetical protein